MPFDWKEYISLAENLNAGVPSEAQMRSAVGRAYYGSFCICRARKGLSMDRKPDIHARVINLFKESDNSCEYSIGNYLDALRINRNECDYNGFHNLNSASVSIDINKAKSILNLFDQIDNEECD